MACLHNQNHEVAAGVYYLQDKGRYALELHVRCSDCGTRFGFVGLPAGLAPDHPTMSPDRLELRAPIEPDAHMTSLMAGDPNLGFGRFTGAGG